MVCAPRGTEDSKLAHALVEPVCSYELPDELHDALMEIVGPIRSDVCDPDTPELVCLAEMLEEWAEDPSPLGPVAPEWFIREALPALAAAARREDPDSGGLALVYWRRVPDPRIVKLARLIGRQMAREDFARAVARAEQTNSGVVDDIETDLSRNERH